MATPEKIGAVLEMIESRVKKGERLAVVFSAFGGITDRLIEAGKMASLGDERYNGLYMEIEKKHIETIKALLLPRNQSKVLAQAKLMLNDLADVLHGVSLLKELSPKIQDFISSFGERLSASIIAEVMAARQVNAAFLDTRSVIVTDSHFSSARVDFEKTYRNIQAHFADNDAIQVVTGFIAADEKKQTTTLGRSGSDYTAAILGAALEAEAIEIWTDVDGLMTADPRKVKDAFPVAHITYQEAIEISHFGAKVIYPATMQPAMAKHIPIHIKNTFNPSSPGTLISGQAPRERSTIKGISSISRITLLSVQGSGLMGIIGVSSRLFGALAARGVNVVLISQASSEYSICIAVAPEDAPSAVSVLENEFRYEIAEGRIDPIRATGDLSVVALVGENMRHAPGVAGRMFGALGTNGINVYAIAQGSSELNISAVVSHKDEAKALNALHEAFFLSDRKVVHVYLVGTGLVGGALLSMFEKNRARIEKEQAIELRLAGLSNSKKMLFNEEGLDILSWRNLLSGSSGEKADIHEFVTRMQQHNLPNSIFVDCTASNDVVAHYEQVLLSSVSVVTPNKRANTNSFSSYLKLRKASSRFGIQYLYETNVGAGLPVINTLKDLLNSGDQVLRIEAVLSGTISYIFNTFNGETPFSEVVRMAREKGLTEPDPREDLNGMDVARKILILAREAGHQIEMEDLAVENLVPENCREAPTVEAFFEALERADDWFHERWEKAAAQNKKLRYIATLENGKASISLKAVDQAHPFYALSGSDNIISYTTNRYDERPLVVKGPGAGAEVTAAGVFADILKIANT